MTSLASHRTALSVLSVHSILTNRPQTSHAPMSQTLMNIHVHNQAHAFRRVWHALCLRLCLSRSHVQTQNRATPADDRPTRREFIFAWTVMHSKQVCTGNQDWSSRYTAFLSPEFGKPWFMCAPWGCRGNEKCQKLEGLSQFAGLTHRHRLKKTNSFGRNVELTLKCVCSW